MLNGLSTILHDQTAGQAVPQPDLKARMQAKLEARNLSFFYGATQALFDVSLSIPERSVTALIGPSGCGKSTFLRTLNRMNEIIEGTRVSGRVMLEGTDIYEPGIDVVALRKRVGMVFQKSTPFPKSVFENVAYGPRVAGRRSSKFLADLVEACLRGGPPGSGTR